jgi:hypothetical protein
MTLHRSQRIGGNISRFSAMGAEFSEAPVWRGTLGQTPQGGERLPQ